MFEFQKENRIKNVINESMNHEFDHKNEEDLLEKVKEHADIVKDNEIKIYELSRKLPVNDGFRLLELYRESIENVCDAFKVVGG